MGWPGTPSQVTVKYSAVAPAGVRGFSVSWRTTHLAYGMATKGDSYEYLGGNFPKVKGCRSTSSFKYLRGL